MKSKNIPGRKPQQGPKKSGNKKNQVYQNLRERIINGDLAPGLPINEGDFALDLGVSKTPIREALRQLEREGFVDNISGRGSAVSHITSREIHDIFEIREVIETGVVKRVAQFKGGEAIRRKKEEYLVLLADSSKLQNYVHEWGTCEDMHMEIIKVLDNHTLTEMYGSLLDRIRRIRNYYGKRFSDRRVRDIIAEHIDILTAIEEGDPEKAETMIRIHLQQAGAFITGLSV
jgi:GntR family transcriptional regulator, rspAB operon transcriptional repressor